MGIFSMLGSLGSAVIGAQASYKSQQAANKAQAEENAKQREWQKAENDEARAYNKMLAEQQNMWNIEQWNRENAYNTPTAQMARFGAAGLNPNLIYGQTNTAPQLSGSLTSGAPAQPTKGQFDSGIGDRMAASGRDIANQLMQIPMYAAQVANIRAQTKKIEADTKGQNMDNEFTQWLRTSDPYTNSDSPFAKSIAGRRAWMDLQNTLSDNDLKDIQLSLSTFQHQMNQKTADYLLRKLAAETQMTETEAKNFATEVALQLGILKADNRIKTTESLLHNPDFMQKLDNSGWHWATTFANFLKTIVNPFK